MNKTKRSDADLFRFLEEEEATVEFALTKPSDGSRWIVDVCTEDGIFTSYNLRTAVMAAMRAKHQHL